ncbi:hypothetical protein DB88DRAFT_545594 [Papiliotrema laurentii]|uniref:Uncharacterized protein n=1 Tax=Papiliotrema laurentii TaxID=5418 RepID=A0AAD9FR29_PAPLA|nr:hypothetical protein DB88DRAFT_545594 [Papiliotrema laurentii]
MNSSMTPRGPSAAGRTREADTVLVDATRIDRATVRDWTTRWVRCISSLVSECKALGSKTLHHADTDRRSLRSRYPSPEDMGRVSKMEENADKIWEIFSQAVASLLPSEKEAATHSSFPEKQSCSRVRLKQEITIAAYKSFDTFLQDEPPEGKTAPVTQREYVMRTTILRISMDRNGRMNWTRFSETRRFSARSQKLTKATKMVKSDAQKSETGTATASPTESGSRAK